MGLFDFIVGSMIIFGVMVALAFFVCCQRIGSRPSSPRSTSLMSLSNSLLRSKRSRRSQSKWRFFDTSLSAKPIRSLPSSQSSTASSKRSRSSSKKKKSHSSRKESEKDRSKK